MNIQSYNKIYNVEIVNQLAIGDLTDGLRCLIVIDRSVFYLYKDTILRNISSKNMFLIEAIESNKTVETALALCKWMAEMSFKRNDTLVSIGGGIIQDVSGFAANIYMRGVKWLFIPTTLLAQCDSCVGAKTSLNYSNYKNILGTFYAPDKIFTYLDFVSTLSHDDYLSGLGEVAKFNIMAAADGIEMLEDNIDKLLQRDIKTLRFFLERSLEFKKKFIEEDEFDKGLRNLLNFAHTFGHAFETVSQYAIPHGQAVTLGLITANIISCNRTLLDSDLKNRIENLCMRLFSVHPNFEWFSPESIIETMKKDKKRTTDNLTAVLFTNGLNLEIVHDLQQDEVKQALLQLSALLLPRQINM